MATAAFQEARRTHTSFLADKEKQALVAMAKRMPVWVNSDHLTALGFIAMIAAGLAYWQARYNPLALWLVSLLLVINWFGDSLDGTLARVRNHLRPRYGFYVDHILDAIGTLALLAGLAASGYMSPLVAAGTVIAYFLISIEVYLATYSVGRFHISHWKFGPTELRILLIIGNAALLRNPVVKVGGKEFLLFDIGAVTGIVGMTAMLLHAVFRHTRELYRAEPLP